MNRLHTSTLKILFLILTILLVTQSASAEVIDYVRKYKGIEIDQQAINKLKKYDQLVRYFTKFSYFSPKHKVSADFIKALILAESGADPKAVSSKKAIGLGQITYPTGKQAAKELSKSRVRFKYVSRRTLSNLSQEDLYDPAVNILLTCYLIAKYNYKFEGRLDLVLSAWNAGEYTKSLAEMKPAPYSETQNLIGKVNGYYLYLLRH